MSNAREIANRLIGCTIADIEEQLKGLSDSEREIVVSALWDEYHKQCAEA